VSQLHTSKLFAMAGIPDAGTRSASIATLVRELVVARSSYPSFSTALQRQVRAAQLLHDAGEQEEQRTTLPRQRRAVDSASGAQDVVLGSLLALLQSTPSSWSPSQLAACTATLNALLASQPCCGLFGDWARARQLPEVPLARVLPHTVRSSTYLPSFEPHHALFGDGLRSWRTEACVDLEDAPVTLQLCVELPAGQTTPLPLSSVRIAWEGDFVPLRVSVLTSTDGSTFREAGHSTECQLLGDEPPTRVTSVPLSVSVRDSLWIQIVMASVAPFNKSEVGVGVVLPCVLAVLGSCAPRNEFVRVCHSVSVSLCRCVTVSLCHSVSQLYSVTSVKVLSPSPAASVFVEPRSLIVGVQSWLHSVLVDPRCTGSLRAAVLEAAHSFALATGGQTRSLSLPR
jgi:hypothetical protein